MRFAAFVFTILTLATAITSGVYFLRALDLGGGIETAELCFWGGVWAFVTFAFGFLTFKLRVHC
jgi:hypothetical protein